MRSTGVMLKTQNVYIRPAEGVNAEQPDAGTIQKGPLR